MKLVFESLKLDLSLLIRVPVPFLRKLELIYKKYIYFMLRIIGFNKENKGKFLGRVFYFPNKYGYVGLERIIADNAFLTEFLPEGLSVLDIGAHAGEFAFFSRKILHAREVVCVEPFSKAFEVLLKNNLSAYRYAITNKKTAYLNISGISSQLNSIYSDETRDQKAKEKVPVIRLDNLLDKIGKDASFDLLKIDTEGAELEVLQTAGDTLSSFKYILLEVELDQEHFSKLQQVLNIAKGFKLLTLGEYRRGNRSIDILLIRQKYENRI